LLLSRRTLKARGRRGEEGESCDALLRPFADGEVVRDDKDDVAESASLTDPLSENVHRCPFVSSDDKLLHNREHGKVLGKVPSFLPVMPETARRGRRGRLALRVRRRSEEVLPIVAAEGDVVRVLVLSVTGHGGRTGHNLTVRVEESRGGETFGEGDDLLTVAEDGGDGGERKTLNGVEADEGFETGVEVGGGGDARNVEVELNVQELARKVVHHLRESRVPQQAVRKALEVTGTRRTRRTGEGGERVALTEDVTCVRRSDAHNEVDRRYWCGGSEGGRRGRGTKSDIAEGVCQSRRRGGCLERGLDDEGGVETDEIAEWSCETDSSWKRREMEGGAEIEGRRVGLFSRWKRMLEEGRPIRRARRTVLAEKELLVAGGEPVLAFERIRDERHEVKVVLAHVLEDL
jgi:hypothetical protein